MRVQSLERQNLALEEIVVSDEEEAQIRAFAADEDVYKRISESIAPSIFGMDKIKETFPIRNEEISRLYYLRKKYNP